MALTIDNLEIQIETQSKKAVSGVEALTSSLTKLKNFVNGAASVAPNLERIAVALKAFNGVGKINITSSVNSLKKLQDLVPILGGSKTTTLASNLVLIADALSAFSSVPKDIKITPIANGIAQLNNATASLDDARLAQFSAQMKAISDGLSQLNTIEKGNLGLVLKQLKQIPEITKSLDPNTLNEFSAAIVRLTEIIDPLATRMEAIGRAFSAMPAQTKRAIKAIYSTTEANGNLKKSYNGLYGALSKATARFMILYYAMQRIVNVFAEAINESNEYIENLNLFTISMGEATDEAMKYAETVSEAMGIDVADWISNQGVFQRMATGFGIASDQAEIMSKNLTQLAYDMSSFYNTDVETATQKLQSGMSGQIKGLKAWGYNLSVAALQETALSLGIKEKVRNMSEAQKAQLRYITLIQKSQGVMGDMARTINTPSNSMRILSAQMTMLQRAFGNLVSIIATKAIPYIQAFAELLEESLNSWATSLGFELVEIDYSNLELGEEVIDGIGEGIEDTTDEISKLKKQLAGFDEINILNSGNADKTTTGLDYDLGIAMPDYDFLAGLDEATKEQVEKIKERFRAFADTLSVVITLLGTILTILAANWAITGLTKLITAIKALPAVQAILGAFAGGLQNFQLAFEGTGNALYAFKVGIQPLGALLRNVWQGFKKFMSSLSPFTKFVLAIAGAVAVFNTLKDAVYELTKGGKNFGEFLLSVVPICAAVGVAMYAMLGPMGLVITGIAAVVGAIVGFASAENEMRKQFVHDTFYDGYGKKVSELASEFDDLLRSSTAAFDTIIEKQDSIDESKENIKKTWEEVNTLTFAVESGATKIEEAIPVIVEAFKTLYDDTKNYLKDTADLIYAALAGSVGQALKDQGVYIEGIAQATGKVTQEALDNIEKLNVANAELERKFAAGEIDSETYYSSLLENLEALQSWSGVENVLGDAEAAKSGFTAMFAEGINWESSDLAGDLEGFKTAAENAKNTIETSYGSIIDALKKQKELAELEGDKQSAAIFEAAIENVQGLMGSELKDVDNMVSRVTYELQEGLANKIADMLDKTVYEDWDKLSWWEKEFVYKDSIADFASDVLAKYKRDILEPIVEDLKSTFGEESVWIDEFVDNYGNAIFDRGIEDIWFLGNAFTVDNGFDLGETVPDFKEEMQKVLETSSKGTVDGLLAGLDEGQKAVYDAAIRTGKTVLEAYDEALGIHSPSVEMEKRGEYTLQGLVNGLGNTSLLSLAVDNIVKQFDILPSLQNMWSRVTAWWKNLSLPNLDFFSNIGAKISGFFNVGQYASGGFPTMGQMFIARERGPELVGRIGNKNAVANNDQIISGIASAVYNAMIAAQEDNSGSSARIVVQIGDQEVGEASVRYINGKIIQTGESPIYG